MRVKQRENLEKLPELYSAEKGREGAAVSSLDFKDYAAGWNVNSVDFGILVGQYGKRMAAPAAVAVPFLKSVRSPFQPHSPDDRDEAALMT